MTDAEEQRADHESHVDHERRVAENEMVFRDLNERINAGVWPGETTLVTFRCECARLGCTQLMQLEPAEYERARSNPRHFILVAGHEAPDVEALVERLRDYVIVEKLDEAGELAEARDPRR